MPRRKRLNPTIDLPEIILDTIKTYIGTTRLNKLENEQLRRLVQASAATAVQVADILSKTQEHRDS